MTTSDEAILDLMFNPESQEVSLESLQKSWDTTHSTPIDATLLEQLKVMETKAKDLAEKGDTDAALSAINECIALEKDYASAYNNRAQIYRLRKEEELALKDLNKAIELANGQPAVLRQAYTHRAILRRQQGDVEGSREDFKIGAQYGNPIARNINANENPYAKLCNQTMLEVMSREMQTKSSLCDRVFFTNI